MRDMAKFFVAAAAALLLAAPIACAGGGGDDDDAVDANTNLDSNGGGPDGNGGNIDASGGNSDAANATGLYQPCGNTLGACPTTTPPLSCTGITGVGSTTDGWCTPPCNNNDADCAAGYTGPGTPRCAIIESEGADPSLCLIQCTGDGGPCPTGLTCMQLPSSTNWACVVAP